MIKSPRESGGKKGINGHAFRAWDVSIDREEYSKRGRTVVSPPAAVEAKIKRPLHDFDLWENFECRNCAPPSLPPALSRSRLGAVCGTSFQSCSRPECTQNLTLPPTPSQGSPRGVLRAPPRNLPLPRSYPGACSGLPTTHSFPGVTPERARLSLPSPVAARDSASADPESSSLHPVESSRARLPRSPLYLAR